MFEQHPVPQQISSYQFRLVGDMTLKQFFQLAAGAVIGLIVYSLPLPGFFKWPLIALAVIAGAAFAFLPIQDRPLEKWLVAFFRSIYAPTIFVWRTKGVQEQYFSLGQTQPQILEPVDATPLPTSSPHDLPIRNLDKNEENFLSRVKTMFGSNTNIIPPQETRTTPITKEAETLNIEPGKKELEVPQAQAVQIQKSEPEIVKDEAPAVINTVTVGQTLTGTLNIATQAAQFSPDAAPPIPPSQPNIIVGQVMDKDGKIVEGAILEITDLEGRPVRALKSNKAGHFLIVTPLPNGEYRISVEKDGLEFMPVNVTVSGEIVEPIAIKAKTAL